MKTKVRIISVLLMAAVLISTAAAALTVSAKSIRFSDVKSSSWYYDYVIKVCRAGTMEGKGDGKFAPLANMTRAEAVTVFCRLTGFTDEDIAGLGDSLEFVDTKPDHWYADYVGWAVEYGVVKGYDLGDGKQGFKPNEPVKRREFALMIANLLTSFSFEEITAEPLTECFTDQSDFPAWAAEAIEQVRLWGIFGGDDKGNFNPASSATRAETAAILTRLPDCLENIEEIEYAPGDPNPDNMGVAYTDEDSGIKVSYLDLIDDGEGNPVTASELGIHGGHETKVCRTEYGTYAVYMTGTGDGYNGATPEFTVVKITSEGTKVILSDTMPYGSSTYPNLINGGNGKIYVVVLSWLQVYTIDAETDTYTASERVTPQFTVSHHGFGYSQPIYDEAEQKIYGLYTCGDIVGYISWFIYDIETGIWDRTCYTIKTDFRYAYFTGFADGEGGFVFVGQRCLKRESLNEYYGVNISGSNYIWDELYIFKVDSAHNLAGMEDYEQVPIFQRNYIPGESYTMKNATHYGSGAVHLDQDGNIHVMYTATPDSLNNTKRVYTQVFDMDLNQVVPEQEIRAFESTTYKSGLTSYNYFLAYAEGTDGTMYILSAKSSKTAKLEILSSTDGGETYTLCMSPVELKVNDGNDSTVDANKFIVSGPRNYSIMDNIIGILTYDDDKNMYYYSIELP